MRILGCVLLVLVKRNIVVTKLKKSIEMVNSGERTTKAFLQKKSNKVESLTKKGDSPVDLKYF